MFSVHTKYVVWWSSSAGGESHRRNRLIEALYVAVKRATIDIIDRFLRTYMPFWQPPDGLSLVMGPCERERRAISRERKKKVVCY